MANKKLTDLTELLTPADGDFLYIVDVSDTTQSAQGTSKKIKKQNIVPVTTTSVSRITIAQIRALIGTLPNTNFYTTDLGQEGNWYYDASDTTSADNTGTILVTADGKRIKRVIEDGINIKWFGAVGNSTYAYIRNQIGSVAGNDDGTAIQNAINYCLTTGQKLYVPVGIYRTTVPITITYPNGLTMEGEGKPFEISFDQYTNGTSPLYKGVLFVRDYTGAPLFTFRGGLLSSDPDWSTYRDGKMWKTDIKNIGFTERTAGGAQPAPTTNSTSLVLAKRSILMRFKNCLFIGSATSNFEGFQIDDSVFDDCRFISGGSRLEAPNMLLHRVTTISGETTYGEATNSLTFIACIFEGNNGRNLLIAPASYTRADGTAFTESGQLSALQILGGLFKYPNLRSSSSLNNVELNNVSSANCSFAMSHKGCVDASVSTSSEILKIFNSSTSYFNVQAEKLANVNFTLTNFINVTGGTAINVDAQLTDVVSGISGTEGVTIAGGSVNVVTGSLSTVTGTKILTNNHVQFFPNKTAPSASAGGVTIYSNTSNKLSTIDNAGIVSAVVGEALDNVFTGRNTFQPSLTPVSGTARAIYLKPTLTATANNDFLYAYTFEPTFVAGAFTGVKRLFTTILGGGTFQLNGSSGNIEIGPSGDNIFFTKAGLNIIDAIGSGASLLLRGNSYVAIGDGSTNYMRMISATGNFMFQNGGVYTDDGVNRLQVNGTIKASAATLSTQVVIKSQLDLKADLASPALTGVPTAPTATAGTNTTQVATTAFVQAADANNVKLTGNQNIVGMKSFVNTVSGTSDAGFILDNNSSDSNGMIQGRNDSTGRLINALNTSTGTTILLQNQNNGVGLKIDSGESGSNGISLILESKTGHGATTKPLQITENAVEKAFFSFDGKLTAEAIISNTVVRLKSYTVATLPAGTQGDTAYVTDATSPTYLGTLTGGGSVKCPVFYNGASWVSH